MTDALCRILAVSPLLPLFLAACHEPQPASAPSRPARQVPSAQVAQMREPNILGVAAFYDPFDPWIWTQNHEKPRGIVIKALYLKGPNTKGVFGDGTIRPRLYVRELTPQGEVTWTLVKEWALTVEQAVPFRSNKPSEMGWGYRLHLPWDELSALGGRQVRIVVEFDRVDGRKVSSGKKDFRVPTPGST